MEALAIGCSLPGKAAEKVASHYAKDCAYSRDHALETSKLRKSFSTGWPRSSCVTCQPRFYKSDVATAAFWLRSDIRRCLSTITQAAAEASKLHRHRGLVSLLHCRARSDNLSTHVRRALIVRLVMCAGAAGIASRSFRSLRRQKSCCPPPTGSSVSFIYQKT